jgi:hypothetical protein
MNTAEEQCQGVDRHGTIELDQMFIILIDAEVKCGLPPPTWAFSTSTA